MDRCSIEATGNRGDQTVNAKNTVTFDSALPMFAEILSGSLGQCVLDEGTFLRDVSGRLTLSYPMIGGTMRLNPWVV